jgi:hypothetical protein
MTDSTTTPPASDQPSDPQSPAEPRKARRLRRWLMALGVVAVLLMLLVVLAPTIASTGPVRSLILSQADGAIPGRLSVDDWSLSWTGGITLNNLRLYDQEDALILEVPKFHTDLSLLAAARGGLALGQTSVDVSLTQFVIDEQGRSNYEKALGIAPAPKDQPPPPAESPSRLPDLSGRITVNILGGTIVAPGVPPVHLEPGSVALNIADTNAPIENTIALAYRVAEQPVGRIDVTGNVDAIDNNQIAIAGLSAKQSVKLSDVDLAGLAAFAPPEMKLALLGKASGQLDVTAASLADLAATGQIDLTAPGISGGPLAGDDRFATSRITIPIAIAQRMVDGAAVIDISRLAIESPDFSVTVTGQVPQQAVQRIIDGQAPGASGQVQVVTSVPDLSILNQLDDTLALQQNVRITGGQYKQTATVMVQPERLVLSQIVDVNVAGEHDKQPIQLDPIHLEVSAAAVPVAGHPADLRDLAIALTSSFATISGGGPTLASLNATIDADLGKANAQLRQFVKTGTELAGTVQLRITSQGDATAANQPLTLSIEGSSKGLTVQPEAAPQALLSREDATFTLGATIAPDRSAVQSLTADLRSRVATLSIKDARLLLTRDGAPVPAFDMLQQADVSLDVPSLPELYALLEAMQPSPPVEAGQSPPQPIRIAGGSTRAKIAVRDQGATTRIDVTELVVSGLALERGQESYRLPGDVNLQLSAGIEADQAINAIALTASRGDLAVATLALPQPIVVKMPADGAPTASGTIEITGQYEQVTPLLAFLQGQPASALPYSGKYALRQILSTQGDEVRISGGVSNENVQVMQDGKVAFAESRIDLSNDITLDLAKSDLVIGKLNLTMPQSQALALQLNGAVRQFDTQRRLDGVHMTLAYDLAKLWPLVKPMLDPQTQQDLAAMQIAGAYSREWTLAGSFPAVGVNEEPLAFEQAVRLLVMDGGIALGLLDHQGITVKDLDLVVGLKDGQLAVQPVAQPQQPATFNGGALNVQASVDLTQPAPRLSMPERHQIVRKATVNPLLGDTLGKFINPVFTNSTRASGLLTVTINECKGLALGDALYTPDSGRAVITFTLAEMQIANPLGSLMVGQLNQLIQPLGFGGAKADKDQADAFQGEIRDAYVEIDHGMVNEKITMMLANAPKEGQKPEDQKPAVPLTFSGDVRLSDQQQNLDVILPAEYIAERSGGDTGEFVRSAFPDGIPIKLEGTTSSPKLNYGAFGDVAATAAKNYLKQQVVKEVGKQVEGELGGLLQDAMGGKGQASPRQAPAPEKKKQSLGGLLEGAIKQAEPGK